MDMEWISQLSMPGSSRIMGRSLRCGHPRGKGMARLVRQHVHVARTCR